MLVSIGLLGWYPLGSILITDSPGIGGKSFLLRRMISDNARICVLSLTFPSYEFILYAGAVPLSTP